MATDAWQLAHVLPPALCAAVAVTALVASDCFDYRPGRYLGKPIAALAFVWMAISLGAPDTPYGSWLLAGLLCCLAGDLLLMPDSERCFLAGLVAFLCGHLLYGAAFLHLPRHFAGLAASAIPAVLLLVFVARWLLPRVPARMQWPVGAYTLVITGMLLCAGLSAGQPGSQLIIGGAWRLRFATWRWRAGSFSNPAAGTECGEARCTFCRRWCSPHRWLLFRDKAPG